MSTDKKTSDHNYYLAHREDIKHRTRLYALSLKGKEVQRLAQAKYRKTTSSLEAKRRYKRTRKGKLAARRSEQSEKGKARHHRYAQKPHAKELTKERVRRSFLRRTYGLELTEYNRLCEKQLNCCLICKKSCPKLVVDHKVEGSYRGLLCNTCNVGLGMFREDINILKSAIAYLCRNPG